MWVRTEGSLMRAQMVNVPVLVPGFRCGAVSLAGPFNDATLDRLPLRQPLQTGIRR